MGFCRIRDSNLSPTQKMATQEKTNKNTPKADRKTEIKKRILPTALVALTVPFILCFSVPFEIYSNNRDEFLFSAGAYMPLLLLFGLLAAVVVFFALLFLKPLPYRICRNVYLAVAFLLFLQGNYLNRGLSAFSTNGSGGGRLAQKIGNGILWLVLLGGAAGVAFIKDKKNIAKAVCLVLSAVILATQSVTFVSNAATHKGVFASKNKRSADEDTPLRILTAQGLTELSRHKNVLYFCVDEFDEYYAECAALHDPDIFDTLDGFTWFQDDISLYGHTYPSVPYMITGKEYDATKRRVDYLDSAFAAQGNRLTALHDAGYKIGIYTQQYYCYTLTSQLPDYVENVSPLRSVKVRNSTKISANMMRMAMLRCFPQFLKSKVGVVHADLCNRHAVYMGENGYREHLVENKDAYKEIKREALQTVAKDCADTAKKFEATLTDENVFKFIHISGCHACDASFETDDPVKKGKTTKQIRKAMRQSMNVIEAYVDMLKAAGDDVYKNATIVITGDHPAPHYNTGALGGVKLTALLAKPSGAAGTPLTVSAAQVSHCDIWPTIYKETGVDTSGVSLFEIDEHADRDRRFIWQTYRYDNTMDQYVYTIRGAGKSFANWEQTGKTHYDRGIMH